MENYQEQLDDLLIQEETLQFTEFNNLTAYRLGTTIVDIAMEENLAITIDICRNGQQLFHCALPGTSPDNDEWIKRKNRVVNRFGHSSFYVGTKLRSQGVSLQEKYLIDPMEYAAHGGAFPIIIENVGVVGTITVSGLPQADDHALVVRVLTDFLKS